MTNSNQEISTSLEYVLETINPEHFGRAVDHHWNWRHFRRAFFIRPFHGEIICDDKALLYEFQRELKKICVDTVIYERDDNY